MSKPPTTDDKTRSYTMSRIKSKDTSIELMLRKALWGSGIRYRKNYKKLPGAPDIAITKHRIAIFCDGDFWHGKNWSTISPKLKNNRVYWVEKIERNIRRDCEADMALHMMGWTVVRFWGSEIHKNLAGCVDDVKDVLFHKVLENERRYERIEKIP